MSDKPNSKLQVAQTQIQSTDNSPATGSDPGFNAATISHTNSSNALELAFYLCGGITCFMGVYCAMSLVNYWKDTYGATGYIEMVFFSNVGGFTAFLIYKRVFTNINTQTVLLIVPWINLGLNSLVILAGKWIPDQRSPIKIIISGVANPITGITLFVLRYSYSSLVFQRGPTHVAFYNAGMPISGICFTAIGMI